jgi:hypothetical protein
VPLPDLQAINNRPTVSVCIKQARRLYGQGLGRFHVVSFKASKPSVYGSETASQYGHPPGLQGRKSLFIFGEMLYFLFDVGKNRLAVKPSPLLDVCYIVAVFDVGALAV